MSSFYAGRKVVVTGGSGFIGSHVVEALARNGALVRAVGSRNHPAYLPLSGQVEYLRADLLRRDECERAFHGADFVFHVAAVGWGFHENLKRQPELLTSNLLLNTTVLDAAYRAGIQRFLLTSSLAVYPGYLEDLCEDAPWDQPPHEGELYYGWAKRMSEIQAKAYFQHYGMPIAIVRPSNPYGPGDNFDPQKSHVIPALIRRAMARENPFIVWGTGRALRTFVHVRDVAKGMLLALEKHPVAEPINLASDELISIADLTKIVIDLTGHTSAKVVFDTSKPDGHPCRLANVGRAMEILELKTYTPLKDGLKETIHWYADQAEWEHKVSLPSSKDVACQ